MHPDKNLRDLAARVSKGDPTAAVELRHSLEPQMTVMARTVMRRGSGTSPLARRILAEAGRLADACSPDEDKEHLARQVARSITESVIDRLRSQPGAPSGFRDTVLV